MARREIGEINAGSMADIAFLLLIFFLVTTTMEVDAGIGRQLPVKLDINLPPPPPVNERNVLKILANKNDQLLVEESFVRMDDLCDIVMKFYTVNLNGERDINMPLFETITLDKCRSEIASLNVQLTADAENVSLQSEISKWEEKASLVELIGPYKEIHKSAVIQLKNQAGTSYGLYMEVQNILKQVVNELRVEACEKYEFPDYFTLREDRPEDMVYINMLRILVPERILESKIEN